jgi:C1A family cysteine protease
MSCLSSTALATLVALAATACAPEGLPPGRGPDGQELSDLDEIMGDAPDNSTLPVDAKEDAALPPTFSLLDKQSSVKDQARRGVCTIFATVALMEHIYIMKGYGERDFSEQHLQWALKNVTKYLPNSSGGSAGPNGTTLAVHGTVAESVWPYEPYPWNAANDPACVGEAAGLPTRCYTNGEPPAQVAASTIYFMRPEGRYINNKNIRTHMVNNRTAVMATFGYYEKAWYNTADYYAQGIVMTPSDEEVAAGAKAGHAVLLVGWDEDLELPRLHRDGSPVLDAHGNAIKDRGFYYFKNSWGTGWAPRSRIKPGYGLISRAYIERHASAYTVTLPN